MHGFLPVLFFVLPLSIGLLTTSASAGDDYDVTKPWVAFGNAAYPSRNADIQRQNAYYVATDGDDSNPGGIDKPWRDIGTAVKRLKPGDALYLRGGTYSVTSRIQITGKNPKNEARWITISSFKDEKAVIDAHAYDRKSASDSGFTGDHGGVLDITGSNYIRIQNLKIQNAHLRGISISNSNNIEITHNEISNTYACGIAVWDTTWPPENKKNVYKHVRILANRVTKANTFDMTPAFMDKKNISEPPHEAISIAGATDFEVAFNEVSNCDKEGIDVKENSKNGTVHHNYVARNARQGLYADAWFGTLENVSFYNNIVYDNKGAGLALSVEGDGSHLQKVSFHHNLVYRNWGPGMFISRWGNDLLREDVDVYNNTFFRNGFGGGTGNSNFWISGGILFYSGNIKNLSVRSNIFSGSDNFEIGFDTKAYGTTQEEIDKSLQQKGIMIEKNLINYTDKTRFPYKVPYTGYVLQYYGSGAMIGDPRFRNTGTGDFRLSEDSPGQSVGCFAQGDAY